MPNTPEEWQAVLFSAVILAIPIGIGINLWSNWLQRYLDKHFERRYSKRMERDKKHKVFVEAMVNLAETDQGVLTVMAHLAAKQYTRSTQLTTIGVGMLVAGLVMQVYQPANPTEWTPWIKSGASAISLILAIFAIVSAIQIYESTSMYSDVVYTHFKKHQVVQAAIKAHPLLSKKSTDSKSGQDAEKT